MADFLEDDDSSEMADHRFGYQEWDKLEENFVNAGYREGITVGKEEALQEGFDNGFAGYGAPTGRDIGTLRGIATALLFHIHNMPASKNLDTEQAGTVTSAEQTTRQKEEAKTIVSELATVKLLDILPPDVEALEHAKDHADADGRGTAAKDADIEIQEVSRKWEAARDKLNGLRSRINALAVELQLNIKV